MEYYATYMEYAIKKINQVVDSLTNIVMNEQCELEYRLEASKIIMLYFDDVINYQKNDFKKRVDI